MDLLLTSKWEEMRQSLPIQSRQSTHMTWPTCQSMQSQQYAFPVNRMTGTGIDPMPQALQPATKDIAAHQLP